LVTIPGAALAKKLKPLMAMTLGIGIAATGWFVLGLVPSVPGTVAGMMLFAVGEAIQAPRFYEYVSNLAPPEQVGTYMGFAFLPIAVGTFLSGWSSGYLVAHYVEGGNPAAPSMWFIVGSYGIATMLLLFAYDRVLAPRRVGG